MNPTRTLPSTFYRRFGKRLLDWLVAVIALWLCAPVLLVLAIIIRIRLGPPILFRQLRPGWHGRPFMLYKFRTMTEARDTTGRLRPDGERLTHFGRFLRATSLDELPELLNVLRGDMSLVGPRPLLMRYLDRYTPEQQQRHAVPPGITGWAQINGRNSITWEDRFALDVWYIYHLSFWLDAKIMAMTLWKVLKREGIAQSGQATMEEFQGTERP